MEEAIPFNDLIESLCVARGDDQKSRRTAAVTSALVEVIQEKINSSSMNNGDVVSPASMYASILNALTSSLTSIQVESLENSPQLCLLEILSQVIPYVSSSNPNLYIHQFSTVSRVLRGIVNSIPAPVHSSPDDKSSISVGWNSLLRQTMKTASIAINGILILENTHPSGKEVLRCFHATIMEHFNDPRAKVRRQAHASAIELLHLSSSILREGKTPLATLITDHVVEYSHQIVLQYIPKSKKQNKDKGNKTIAHLLHLLSFLESILSIIDIKGRQRLGQDLIKLLEEAVSKNDVDKENFAMIANGTLSALLHIFDPATSEFSLANNTNEEEDSFCAHAWSSLLQLNAKFIACTQTVDERGGMCRQSYAQCIAAIALRLLQKYGPNSKSHEVMTALSLRLIPLSIKSIVNCMGDTTISSEIAQSLCAELGRIFRSNSFENLISQENGNKTVEGCTSAMSVLLQQRFHDYWDSSLPVLASFLVQVVHGTVPQNNHIYNEESLKLMDTRVKHIIESIVQLRCDSKSEALKQSIEVAIEIFIQGVGLELFLHMTRLVTNEKSPRSIGIVSSDRGWILALLKKSFINAESAYRPRIDFFTSNILDCARRCDLASKDKNLTSAEVSMQSTYVVDFWSLFPSFCVNPIDLHLSFSNVAKKLCFGMADPNYPQLLGVICHGLTTLANNVQKESGSNEEAIFTQEDVRVVSQNSEELLYKLFGIVRKLYSIKKGSDNMDVDEETDVLSQKSQQAKTVTDTIAALAPLASEKFLKELFKKMLAQLMKMTQLESDESGQIYSLLGLSEALVKSESLDEKSIELLYRSIKPFIRSDEYSSRVQKRAYKVFSEICQHYTDFATSTARLDEIIELLIGSTIALQISARNMRLKCLAFIIEGLDRSNKTQMDAIPNIVGEVLLCLKDANSKTRESAYQLLLTIGKVKDDMTEFFQIIVGGLGAQTTHMRSAAVMALSRIVFEYARDDITVQSLLPSLLQTVTVLFDENSREVIKSVIGFVRVSIAALNKDQLEPLLPEVVTGLMKFNRGKGRFRSKIKIIMKRLVKKFGYEALLPLVPASDTRLLTHMRKLSERAARRKAANIDDGLTTVGEFDDLMDSDEEDSDGGRTFMTGVTGFTQLTGKMSRKSIRSMASSKIESNTRASRSMNRSTMTSRTTSQPLLDVTGEKNGEIIDMLDPKATKSVRFMDEDGGNNVDSDDDSAAMEFDDSGKLLIFDHDEKTVQENKDGMDRDSKRLKISKFESALAARDEVTARKNKKNTKVSSLGSAYKSKKAGGDVKKKNQKYEPYAFVPLDGRNYTKKNRGKSVEKMTSVVRQKATNKRKRR